MILTMVYSRGGQWDNPHLRRELGQEPYINKILPLPLFAGFLLLFIQLF